MLTRSWAFALVLLSGRTAWSQYDAPPADQTRKAESTALPRMHDGFYASLQVGPSYLMASSEAQPSSAAPDPGTREFRGPSLSLRIALGGTIKNRVVVGALLGIEPVLSLTAKDESGQDFDTYGAKFMLRQQGALIDYYFLPRGGFHLLGSLGLAQLGVRRTELDDDGDSPSGTYWMLGFGHEWWVADEASLGVLATVTDGTLEVQETTSVDVDLFSFGIALTATIN